MQLIKQLRVLSCLKSGHYKIIGSEIFCYQKGQWRAMRPNILPTGYKQVTLYCFNRKGKGFTVVVYIHQVIFLHKNNATYNPEYEIDHEDNNASNNSPNNLRAVPTQVNIDSRTRRQPPTPGSFKTIRKNEIRQIKHLATLGLSQASIARQLDLNRLSVRYILIRIQEGLPLKYA